MTITTMTPTPPQTRVGRGQFAPLLWAEWIKFRTVRGWIIAMTVGAFVTVGWGLLVANGNDVTCQPIDTGPVLRGAACLPHYPLGPDGEAVTDSFSFVSQPLIGDGSITVRVSSLTGRYSTGGSGAGAAGSDPGSQFTTGVQPWSKAGIIIKTSTAAGSAYAAMMVTGGHGVRMQDNYTHDTPGVPGAVSPASPRWLRLTRTGDTLTGYDSTDGTHWTRVGTAHLVGLPSTVQAGLFATSPTSPTVVAQSLASSSSTGGPSQATAAFDHLTESDATPAGWRSSLVGGAGSLPSSATGISAPQPGGGYIVTGSGDIAPIVAGADASMIGPYLSGAFAGLIAAIVVAAMFVTAEYRRGLIRTTLAATPRRGRVLAAKAVVAGAVTFAAGLAACGIVLPLALLLGHAKGAYALPVSALTELRVVAGTAAVLAVSAVLAVATGTILRRSAAAVTTGIVAIVLPYVLATTGVLPGDTGQWLLRFTPAAAFAIQQSAPAYPQVTASYATMAGYFPLPGWAGFGVLCGYTALALTLAFHLLRHRDA
jgi:ABC-type transport system involved in multi-copper enzyme maturation permease subunit